MPTKPEMLIVLLLLFITLGAGRLSKTGDRIGAWLRTLMDRRFPPP